MGEQLRKNMRLAQKAREENNLTTASLGKEVHVLDRIIEKSKDSVDADVQTMMKEHDFPDSMVIKPDLFNQVANKIASSSDGFDEKKQAKKREMRRTGTSTSFLN